MSNTDLDPARAVIIAWLISATIWPAIALIWWAL